MGYENIVEDEQQGVGALIASLTKVTGGVSKVTVGKVTSVSPLKIKLNDLPDLLDRNDVVMLAHVAPAVGSKVALLSVDKGISWIALGRVV